MRLGIALDIYPVEAYAVCVCVGVSCANDASGTTVLGTMQPPSTQSQYCLISVVVMVILLLHVLDGIVV